jgi:heme/copper-type cytochrome/quinol oxidase subunit 2
LFLCLIYDFVKQCFKYAYLVILAIWNIDRAMGFYVRFQKRKKGAKSKFYSDDEVLYEDSRGRVVYVKDPSFSVWDSEIRAYGKRDDRARELCELRELIYDRDAIKIILFLKDDPTQTLKESLYGAYLRTIARMRAQKRTARLLNFRPHIIASYYFATFRIFIYRSRSYFTCRLLHFLLIVQYDRYKRYFFRQKRVLVSRFFNLLYIHFLMGLKKLWRIFRIPGKFKPSSQRTAAKNAQFRFRFKMKLIKFYLNSCFSAAYIRLHNKSKIRYFSHATRLELYWTIIPIFIILCILIPSVFLMYGIDEDVDTAVTVNVVGHQWYWSYSYDVPFLTNISQLRNNKLVLEFDSYMLDEINNGAPRLLATDKILLLPETVHINFLISATDVIHSWAVPSFGVKVDAVPGRINRADVFLEQQGMFFGQCSELCGVNHSYMPIQVQSVEYHSFLEKLLGKEEQVV